MRERFHSNEFPDDVQVAVPRPSGEVWELMWVRVIAFDSASHEFLGQLLNQPTDIPSITEGDNVAFALSEASEYPVGIDRGQGFAQAAYPAFTPVAFREALLRGLNRYRAGNMGHAPEALAEAVRSFTSALSLADASTSSTARFYNHFYLGRCYAELYQTADALAQFQSALSYRQSDPHAHMALLAEYSVLAATPPEKLPTGSPEEWKAAFIQEEAQIRSLFSVDSEPIRTLNLIYKNFGNPPSVAGRTLFRYKRK